mmetsp:Transcript_86069/g.221620  ORF Transcript_86069/g.221620 Transcript_86069/m.221620 type:complete len:213 (+) Transcript_86069:503-1141(+)
MQRSWVAPKPWPFLKSSESRDSDQLLENIVSCPSTITTLRTPQRPPAMRKTRGLRVPIHRSTAPWQRVLVHGQRQSTCSQEPCQDDATSTADGYRRSSRSSRIRQRLTRSSQRQAARRASRPACLRARWSSPRLSMRVASRVFPASSPPRGMLPQPWPPASLGPRAPLVSSQWSCSHSSSVACRVLKARSRSGSHICMLRDEISVRASLITS